MVPAFVALSRWTPSVSVTVAFPAASVIAPPTAAPATAAPVGWTATCTWTGVPAVAVAGPVRRSSCSLPVP